MLDAVAVAVGLFVLVAVAVELLVAVAVAVRVDVALNVGEGGDVEVPVAVADGVRAGVPDGVLVAVGVRVAVSLLPVGVCDGSGVFVVVTEGTAVPDAAGPEVAVGLGVAVPVEVGVSAIGVLSTDIATEVLVAVALETPVAVAVGVAFTGPPSGRFDPSAFGICSTQVPGAGRIGVGSSARAGCAAGRIEDAAKARATREPANMSVRRILSDYRRSLKNQDRTTAEFGERAEG